MATRNGSFPPDEGLDREVYLVAAVVVVGVVLTALLAAVAVTAVSVAIAAVVLRSLVNGAHKR